MEIGSPVLITMFNGTECIGLVEDKFDENTIFVRVSSPIYKDTVLWLIKKEYKSITKEEYDAITILEGL